MYDKELDKEEAKHEGDPLVSFHEFQIILARVAFEMGLKNQNILDKKDQGKQLTTFFSDKLNVRTNQEVGENKPFINLNKPFLKSLEASYANQLKNVQSQKSSYC